MLCELLHCEDVEEFALETKPEIVMNFTNFEDENLLESVKQ